MSAFRADEARTALARRFAEQDRRLAELESDLEDLRATMVGVSDELAARVERHAKAIRKVADALELITAGIGSQSA